MWELQHSVETAASADFAWAYMTDIANWDDPPAQFRLEGPFIAGARGATDIPGQPSRLWQVRNVRPVNSYTLELPLDAAALFFTWQFTSLADGRTRLTQHITLEGENAVAHAAEIAQAFGSTLAPGMDRIAEKLDQAYAASQHAAKA